MFQTFRDLREAVETLTKAIVDGVAAQAENGLPAERLEALELSRATWEAEMEAVFLRAEGKLSASSNAEARTRTMVRSYEKFVDPFDEDSGEAEPEGSDIGQADDVTPSPAEGVFTLPVALEATNSKANAIKSKFA